MPSISVFVSYARADDDATYGRITKLKSDIQKAYTALSGESVGVFQDTDSISLGDKWRDRIRAGLTSSSILLAFASPAFLRSTACREEFSEFLGFLRTDDNLRLIIPLIFADVQRLDDQFVNDDIWQELSKLQRLPIKDLRTADPGTALWLTNVERIAKRIEEVLADSDQRAAALPETYGANRQHDSEGAMEIFAKFETAIPRFTENIEKFGELFSSLTATIGPESDNMQRATTFSQRLAITNRLASKLEPIAKKAESLSNEIKSDANTYDRAVRRAVQLTRSGTFDSSKPNTISGFEAIRGLATTGIDALAEVDVLASAIEKTVGLSATLDQPLKQLKGSLLVFAEMRGVFRGWLDEIDSLRA